MQGDNGNPWGAAVEQFLAYYRSLANKAGGVPRRADFDPLDIPEILPKIWIYGRVDGRYVIRVTGNDFDRRWGGGVLQGDPIETFIPAHALKRILKRLDRVLETGWYGHGWSNMVDPVSDDLIERAYGPMVDANGERNLVIGVTDFGSVKKYPKENVAPQVACCIDLYDPLSGALREEAFDPD